MKKLLTTLIITIILITGTSSVFAVSNEELEYFLREIDNTYLTTGTSRNFINDCLDKFDVDFVKNEINNTENIYIQDNSLLMLQVGANSAIQNIQYNLIFMPLVENQNFYATGDYYQNLHTNLRLNNCYRFSFIYNRETSNFELSSKGETWYNYGNSSSVGYVFYDFRSADDGWFSFTNFNNIYINDTFETKYDENKYKYINYNVLEILLTQDTWIEQPRDKIIATVHGGLLNSDGEITYKLYNLQTDVSEFIENLKVEIVAGVTCLIPNEKLENGTYKIIANHTDSLGNVLTFTSSDFLVDVEKQQTIITGSGTGTSSGTIDENGNINIETNTDVVIDTTPITDSIDKSTQDIINKLEEPPTTTDDDFKNNFVDTEIEDPSDDFFTWIFDNLENIFLSTEEQTLEFSLYTDNVYEISTNQIIVPDGILKTLVGLSCDFGICYWILKDVRKTINKVKEGSIESLADEDITANMV